MPKTLRHPVRHQVDPDAVFPPPPAEGIVAIAVPALEIEPAARYVPALEPETGPIWVTDLPSPGEANRQRGETGAWSSTEVSERLGRDGAPQQAPKSVEGGAPEWLGPPVAESISPPPPPPGPAAPPALGTNFDSTDFDVNATHTGFLFIPPDPIAAAGPNHLVNVVNVTIRFHQKNGTLDLDTSLASFFSTLSPTTFTFDPKVLYDQRAGRFVVVTLERDTGPNASRIFLAVSDDNDPNGTWCMTTINSLTSIASVDHWADYPGFAVDEEAVYITGNMFSFALAFGGVRLWVVDKGLGTGGLYDCGTATVSVFDPYNGGAAGIETTTQPAHIYGPPVAGVGTWLVSYGGLTDGLNEAVQVVRVDDPLGSTTFTQEFVGIGNIEDFSPASLPDAPQTGTGHLIQTNDRRALHSVWFDDALWMTATIDPKTGDPDSGEATAHWWELDTTGGTVASLVQQGSILGEDIATDTHTFFPSVALNGSGDTAFGYSGSAGTISPGAFYTTRAAGDTAGTTTGSGTLRAGTGSYRRTFECAPFSRWGDYSGIAVDPVDGCFWVYNEFAITTGTATTDCGEDPPGPDEDGRWGTAYGQICPTGSCPIDMVLADITLTGTQTREARSSVRAAEGVTIPTGADVTFKARDRIGLAAGVDIAGDFTATFDSDPCS